MSPVTRLKWPAATFWGVDLQPCKTMTNMLAPQIGWYWPGILPLTTMMSFLLNKAA